MYKKFVLEIDLGEEILSESSTEICIERLRAMLDNMKKLMKASGGVRTSFHDVYEKEEIFDTTHKQIGSAGFLTAEEILRNQGWRTANDVSYTILDESLLWCYSNRPEKATEDEDDISFIKLVETDTYFNIIDVAIKSEAKNWEELYQKVGK